MSDSDSSSLSSVEDAPAKQPAAKKSKQPEPKKSKQPEPKKAAKAGDKRKRQDSGDADDDDRVPIGPRRFVTLSNFRGRFFVDIREYYEDKGSGELKPGKKGIALSLEQWETLKSKMDAIDKLVQDA